MTPTQPTNGQPVPNVAPLPPLPLNAAAVSAAYDSLDSPAPVPLTLGGTTYQMSYRAFAFIEYAKLTGSDLMTDLVQIQIDGQRLKAGALAQTVQDYGFAKLFEVTCNIVWAGAVELQPNVKREDIQRRVGFPELKKAMQVFDAALLSTLPKPDADAAANPTENPTPGGSIGYDSSPDATPQPE